MFTLWWLFTLIIFGCCILIAVIIRCDSDGPEDKKLGRKIARYSLLSPLWPLAIPYVIYLFFSKIVFYKEK